MRRIALALLLAACAQPQQAPTTATSAAPTPAQDGGAIARCPAVCHAAQGYCSNPRPITTCLDACPAMLTNLVNPGPDCAARILTCGGECP